MSRTGIASPPPSASADAALSTRCEPAPKTMPTPPTKEDTQFAALAAYFLRGYLERSPVASTQIGNHQYDARWPDLTPAGDANFTIFIQEMRRALAMISLDSLSPQNAIDASILDNALGYLSFQQDELKAPDRDPLYYTTLIGDGIDALHARDFAPLATRMASLRARLLGVPDVVSAAKTRLTNTPRVFTETAIKQNRGLIGLCEKDLEEDFAALPAQKADLQAAARVAARSLHDFQTFLEKDLLARSKGSFRLGREKFEKTLHLLLEDDVSADDLVAGARALLAQTQDDMAKTAIELWPIKMSGPVPSASTPDERKAIVRQVLAKLADDHPTNLTILDDAKRLLGDATSFVRDHDLVGLPDAPCQLIEMPEYKRGVAIAYCDSTGPLEQKPETFYAISPTPTDWPPERALSFYREYNSSMLVDLTVHEAMPGHYLQAMHANRFKSDVRAVFSNGSFVEGWAVYGEWLMTKYGFGGAAVRLQRQKMLARVAANAILDHEIHAGLMDEEAALALMKNEAFQEDGEAVAKWRRARLTSGQLSTYYYGFRELMKLRAEAEGAGCFKRRAPEAEGIKRRAPEAEGSNGRAPEAEGINERAYHDKLLSFGSPAPRYLHALMATP